MPQCFFYIEENEQDPEEGTVRALCVACRQSWFPVQGWFYEGQFGPWMVKCHHCSETIHDPESQGNREDQSVI
jgi:hypothetical protein